MKSGIYLITCRRAGELPLYYVGQAQRVKARWNEHLRDLRKNQHNNPYLQNAWNKYGPASFHFEVVQQIAVSDLDQAEQWWLDEMHGHQRCANISKDVAAPNRGRVTSDETKRKISAANKGGKRTEEQRRRMREGCIGRVATEETRAILSAAHKKRENFWTPELRERLRQANLGKTIPPEQRAKMSAAKLGMKPTESTIEILRKNAAAVAMPVLATCVKTGETLLFPSIASTAAAGFTPQNIWQLLHKRGKTHKGYTWQFITANTELPSQAPQAPL